VIKATDIKIGSLGDCWIYGALACMSEKQGLIEKVFSKIDTERGLYSIRICVDGAWEEIIVDDHVPVSKETGHAIFTTT
jgi:Calpain family cysteine protease